MFTGACFLNHLWELIWFLASLLSLVFAQVRYILVWGRKKERKGKMSHVSEYHKIWLMLHLRHGSCGPVIQGMCFNREY